MNSLIKLSLTYWNMCVIIMGFTGYALGQEADGTNCPSGVSGLCTPGVFESATETVTETVESDATGTTTTTTTTTDTTTTTVTVPETGDLLTDQKVQEMGRNQKFGGDMTSDWGGQ
ncbi:MAG: hypothetical protein VYA01_05540, partial [Bacteroidota bacterium]|nr:hypothetical protein [Bacteroidota bacterium]